MPIECFNCGGEHFARECPEKGKGGDKGGGKGKAPMECFNCKGPHMARDCPNKGSGKGKGKGGPIDCFNCGGDHFARDCPKGSSKGKGKPVECFNCGGDHFARDCPEERKDNGKGKGGKGKGGKGKGGKGGKDDSEDGPETQDEPNCDMCPTSYEPLVAIDYTTETMECLQFNNECEAWCNEPPIPEANKRGTDRDDLRYWLADGVCPKLGEYIPGCVWLVPWFDWVCGIENNVTYQNPSEAHCNGVFKYTKGRCEGDELLAPDFGM